MVGSRGERIIQAKSVTQRRKVAKAQRGELVELLSFGGLSFMILCGEIISVTELDKVVHFQRQWNFDSSVDQANS